MTILARSIEELRQRRRTIALGGGEDKLQRRRDKGLLTARERLALLFQEHTFQEVGMHARRGARSFDPDDRELPADGVITGTGYVNGQLVAAFSQDFTVSAGTLGKMHARQDRRADGIRHQDRHPAGRLQGFRRRPHPGGGRCAFRLRRRLLPQRPDCPASCRRSPSSAARAPAVPPTRRR